MGLTSRVWVVAISTVLLAWASGCDDGSGATQSSGGGGTGAQGGAGGTGGEGGGAPYGDSAAHACFADRCASAIDACKADPECPAFLSCLEACPVDANGDADAACVAACPTGSGTTSKKAAADVDACRTTGPGAACLTCTAPLPEPESPVLKQTCPDPSMETNVCFECEDEKCCETYVACKQNPECDALIKGCMALCAGEPTCQKDCVAQHPDGADDAGARFACMIVGCFADAPMCDRCQRGPLEACLYGTCGDAYAAFLSGKDGYALEGCIFACPIDDTACDTVCHNTYPEAYERYGLVADCIATECDLQL